MEPDYDLSLEGDALYFENRRKWLDLHKDCRGLRYYSDGRLEAVYVCPTAQEFSDMKIIAEKLK